MKRKFLALGLIAGLLGSGMASAQTGPFYLSPDDYGKTVLSPAQSLGNAAQIVSEQRNIFEPIGLLREDDALRQATRGVGRLDIMYELDGERKFTVCTATIVLGGKAILTNHHCIPGHQGKVTGASLLLDYYDADSPVTRVRVDIQASAQDRDLDFAIVPLLEAPPAGIKPVVFSKRPVQPRDRLTIVHHPAGKPKMMTQFRCMAAPSVSAQTYLRHLCDTLPGSSGAPIFNSDREIVGIHHRGGMDGNDPRSFNMGSHILDVMARAQVLASHQPSGTGTTGQPSTTTGTTAPAGSGADRLNQIINSN